MDPPAEDIPAQKQTKVSRRKRTKASICTQSKKQRAQRRRSSPRMLLDVADAVLDPHAEGVETSLEPLITGKWEVNNSFHPLPPAPYFEGNNVEYDMVSSLDLFKKYIPDEIISQIARATNANIISSTGKEVVITTTDIKKFFGITIMMSYLKYPRIKMYWASGTKIQQISDAMPRNKYFLIRNHLRCQDYTSVSNEEKENNKYWKVSPVINSVRAGCLLNPRPNEVSMDEQMVPFWRHTGDINEATHKGKTQPL